MAQMNTCIAKSNTWSKKLIIYERTPKFTHRSDQVMEVTGTLGKGQQVRQVACWYLSEGHLENRVLRAL